MLRKDPFENRPSIIPRVSWKFSMSYPSQEQAHERRPKAADRAHRRLDGKTRQSFVGQAPACPRYTTHRNSALDKWLQNGTLRFRKALQSFKKRHLATKKLTENLISLHENPQKLTTAQESSQCDNRTPLQIINGVKNAWYFAKGRWRLKWKSRMIVLSA